MHPDHRSEFDVLADRLDGVRRGRPILFFINPGNWGDSLIREGAEDFLRSYGFPYLPVRFKDILKRRTSVSEAKRHLGHDDPVMVYNGCGAFSQHYSMADKVCALAQNFSTNVFLPATFAIDMDRQRFPNDTHFFVRDRFESASKMPEAPFCHDMAFHLSPVAAAPVKKAGYFLRTDAEAPDGQPLPKDNLDLSRLGRAHTPIDGFLEHIGAFETIFTNRLHVGIGGALLGRRTEISANDYFKIRAIYQSSIEGYFPKTTYTAAATVAS